MSTNLPIQPMNASNEQNNRHAKKDPPKWLTCPVSINGNTQIKVYDFKEGTLNNELSKVWCNVIQNFHKNQFLKNQINETHNYRT